ncbi:hypothetical protein V8G54_004210 [Vigna mungo]|uniref:Uncharacterized protein n=1 Tax=Vigna mungo TaxID=3915 RepID=A0AAQ3SES6_VIGMU
MLKSHNKEAKIITEEFRHAYIHCLTFILYPGQYTFLEIRVGRTQIMHTNTNHEIKANKLWQTIEPRIKWRRNHSQKFENKMFKLKKVRPNSYKLERCIICFPNHKIII